MNKYRLIKQVFKDNQNATQAEKMSKYMRDQFPFYGIPSQLRKTLEKEIIKKEKKCRLIDWNFLDACWNDEHREMQYFVLDCLNAMHKILTFDDIPKLERFARTKQWWDTIDFLDKIIGNIAFVDDRIISLMTEWSKDDNIWLRRIAIDHQNNRGGFTDSKLLETVIINNLGSNEFFINKAIGWSLRSYSKVNNSWVKTFIDRHKDGLSALSIREASKYI